MKILSYTLFLFAISFVRIHAGETDSVSGEAESASDESSDSLASIGFKGQGFWDGIEADIDFKAIDESEGEFGVDFDVRLDREWGALQLPNLGPLNFHGGSLSAFSKGFIAVNSDDNDLNSIISGLDLSLAYNIAPKAGALTNPGAAGIEAILGEEDPAEDPFDDLAAMWESPLWIFPSLVVKHEATQDFRDYDLAIGAEVAVTTSYLHKPLDSLFNLLRVGEHNNPRHLDLVFGYNYVTELENTALAPLRGGDMDAHRLVFRAEWETGIFTDRQRLMLLYEVNYELDAPTGIKEADKDLNHFFEARIEHLLIDSPDAEVGMSIKYTHGELAPNYEGSSLVGAGFTVHF